MNYEIIRATLEDRDILSNLLQFYMYDFSEYMDLHIEEKGKFDDYPLND